jgi:hypothetical protein
VPLYIILYYIMSENESYMSHILAELHVGYLPQQTKSNQCPTDVNATTIRRVGSCGDIQPTAQSSVKCVDASTQTDVAAEPST